MTRFKNAVDGIIDHVISSAPPSTPNALLEQFAAAALAIAAGIAD